ncbi:MAG TPA: alpha/beta hydrolase-fold protein [Thermoanaerobaculia bacterium]|nr:alpha/beta hydrolase-fold protein [Thermoanaerobaculia bacterium]
MNVNSSRRRAVLLLAVPVLAACLAFRSRSAAPAAALSEAAPMAAVALAETAPVAAVAPEPSRIVVLALTSRVFGNTRSIRVYLPPDYFSAASSRRRYPVFYFNDGFAVFSARLWNAPSIADSLIASGRVAPAILVGIDNAASIPGVTSPERARADEYLPYPDPSEPDLPHPHGEMYPGFVVDEVMPLVASTFRTQTGAANTGIGGASYGGIAALTAVLRKPGVFGALLLESTPLFLFDERLLADSRKLAAWPKTVYIGLGTREADDPALNERGKRTIDAFAAIVRRRSPVTLLQLNVVEGATHGSSAWRARLPAALAFVLPPPAPKSPPWAAGAGGAGRAGTTLRGSSPPPAAPFAGRPGGA